MAFPKCATVQNTAKKYDTSTGEYHRFIPSVPEGFASRVPLQLTSALVNKDLTIKNEQFQTIYAKEFCSKGNLESAHPVAEPNQTHNYIRNVQEKIFITPPAPIKVPLSEMKHSFGLNYRKPCEDTVEAPVLIANCYIEKAGCEQQPCIPPEDGGFWRLTDPYLTINRKDYVLHKDQNIHPIYKTILVTQYNTDKVVLPNKTGNRTAFDLSVFANVLPNRLLGEGIKRVPNYGMQTEFQENYVSQTFSNAYPYLHENFTEFEDALAPASRWQNLPIPGMYCSEYCNIGGKAVRRVVDPSPPKKKITREKHCPRI